MSGELLTVRELAAYLSLNEKKIYALVKRGDIPCTKITGKWLFPKKRIDEWIEKSVGPDFCSDSPGNIRLAGSNDLAIELLASHVKKKFPGLTLLSASVGSMRGLSMLYRGGIHISGVHLFDPATKEYNFPFIRKYSSSLHPVLVNFVTREQGIVTAAGNPLRITGVGDLARPDIRCVNRQPGSGTRLLLDHHLDMAGIPKNKVHGYDNCVTTHAEVALAIRQGRADAGLAIRGAAVRSGLGFVPVATERYDLVIPGRFYYTEPVQQCLDVLRSGRFKEKVLELGGYGVEDTGTVLSWG